MAESTAQQELAQSEVTEPVLKDRVEVAQTATVEKEVLPVDKEATRVAEDTRESLPVQNQAGQKQETELFNENPQQESQELNLNRQTTAKMFEKHDFAEAQVTNVNPNTVTAQVEDVQVTLPTGETVSAREIMEQIVEAARTTMQNNETTLEMILHPEGLGRVVMEVTQKDGNVTAKFIAQNETVKEALESQMFALREQMSQEPQR